MSQADPEPCTEAELHLDGERGIIEGLGVSCTGCHCPSLKPQLPPEPAQLLPGNPWSSAGNASGTAGPVGPSQIPPGIHLGFQSHSCHLPPTPSFSNYPKVMEHQLQQKQFPLLKCIPAPRTAIPSISGHLSSNNRNSPNFRVSSQTKMQR